ncbi:MAG: hypothetical protein AB1714_29145 [Acidobacteriota bacterium]
MLKPSAGFCFALSVLASTSALMALAPPFLSIWPSIDEGLYAYQAQRMVEGQVIYRDFFQFVAPGYFFLLSRWMILLGMELATLRMLMILCLFGSSLLVYLVCRKLHVSPVFSLVASTAYIVLKIRSDYMLSHYGPSALLELAVLALLCAHAANHSRIALCLVGLLVSADILTNQHLGAYLLLACMAVVLLENLSDKRAPWRDVGCLVCGATPLIGLYLAYALFTRSAAAAFHCTFSWVIGTYPQFDSQDYWFHWVRQTWAELTAGPSVHAGVDLALALFETFAAPLSILLAASYLGWERRKGRPFQEFHHCIGTAAIISAALYSSVHIAPNRLLPHVSVPGYLLAYALAHRVYRHWRGVNRQVKARSFLSLSGLVAILFVCVLPLRTAKVFNNIVSYHTTLQKTEGQTPRGSVWLPTNEDSGQLRLLTFLSQRIPQGGPLSAVNWSPWVYYLGRYRNPGPVDYLLPSFVSDENVRRTIAAIERERVTWIVQDNVLRSWMERKDGRVQHITPAMISTWEFNRYRDTRFIPAGHVGAYTIYRRKDGEARTDE